MLAQPASMATDKVSIHILDFTWVLQRSSATGPSSACAPDFLINSAQRGISLCMNFVSSSGELPTTSMPVAAIILSRTSGVLRILTISAFNRSTIAFGVPLGAYTACHAAISKPLTPASVHRRRVGCGARSASASSRRAT